jgi:hypothetical protein
LVHRRQTHPLLALHHLRPALLRTRQHPLFGLRTPEDKLVFIAEHLADGTGVRATARLCKVSLNTVLRFTKRFGKHAERFHHDQVRHVHPKQIQPDEAWAFVGKKRQTL